MNNAAPENTAALQEKIAELEQQLKLSDEGVSHLAERCLFDSRHYLIIRNIITRIHDVLRRQARFFHEILKV